MEKIERIRVETCILKVKSKYYVYVYVYGAPIYCEFRSRGSVDVTFLRDLIECSHSAKLLFWPKLKILSVISRQKLIIVIRACIQKFKYKTVS